MKKIILFLTLFFLMVILWVSNFPNSNSVSKKQTLSICTEEILKPVVEDMIKYFIDSQDNTMDFQVTYIPLETMQREGICKKLRTELMSGKGKDIYLLSEHQRLIDLYSNDENLLLPDANKILYSGVFMDLSPFTASDSSFQSCFTSVTKAGTVKNKQYIMPFSFDFCALKRKADNTSSLEIDDCEIPLADLLDQKKPEDLNTAELLFNVKNWIGNSFDYQAGKVFFSKEDVQKILEVSAIQDKKTIDSGSNNPSFIYGRTQSLFYSTVEEGTEYEYIPAPTINGKPTATVFSYGAIGRTCRQPETAYKFLRLFWQEEFVSGGGFSIEKEGFTAHYCINSIFELEGIPIQSKQWEAWYIKKNGTNSPSKTLLKNADHFIDAINYITDTRFLCTADEIGNEIQNMLLKDSSDSQNNIKMQKNIEEASEMLFNKIRYMVME